MGGSAGGRNDLVRWVFAARTRLAGYTTAILANPDPTTRSWKLLPENLNKDTRYVDN